MSTVRGELVDVVKDMKMVREEIKENSSEGEERAKDHLEDISEKLYNIEQQVADMKKDQV